MVNDRGAAAQDSPGACVLIADNDRGVGGLLAEVLATVGITNEHVLDGVDARARLAAVGFRVLVCDLDMPGVPGLEVLEGLAGAERPPAVVVVSGYVDSEMEERLARWPFVRAVLRKPFDLIEFATLVRSLLGAQSLESGR
ncbi:MAG: response regulator [Planctomycetes bacterium]|nr:response regulator [Planctomycetota bacterium]